MCKPTLKKTIGRLQYCYNRCLFCGEIWGGGYLAKLVVCALWFFFVLSYTAYTAQGAEPLTFVNRDKSKQKHFLLQRSERSNNHRHNFHLSSVRSCFQNLCLTKSNCLSVIITFLLPAVWEVFSCISALRTALTILTADFYALVGCD